MNTDNTLILKAYHSNQLLNEGWMWEIIKFADPTGIISIPDLIRAFNDYFFQGKTFLKLVWLILCIVAVLPVAKYAGKGLMKALKPVIAGSKVAGSSTKVATETSRKLLQSEAELSKTVDLLLKGETTVTKALTKLKLPQQNVSSFFTDLKVFKQNPSLQAAAKAGKTAVKATGKQAAELLQTTFTSPGLMGAGYKARAAKGLTHMGTAGAEEIKRKLDPYRTPEGQRLTAPAGTVRNIFPQTPEQQQATSTATGASTTLPGSPYSDTPVAEPEPQNPEDLATQAPGGATIFKYDPDTGTFLPTNQRKFNITGGSGYQVIPGEKRPVPVMAPPNLPQGSGMGPGGRENMPAGYNIYNPNTFQYPSSFFNSQGGPASMLGLIGNIGGGSAGQSPVGNFANLATGLLGILPGLGRL